MLALAAMRTILSTLLTGAVLATAPLTAQQALTTEVVATGLGRPLLATYPLGETSRLFVVEQGGNIWIIDNGVRLAAPFLNLTGTISSTGERGLLGLAFHPDYLVAGSPNEGQAFINYTNLSGTTVIERFTVDANDPNKLDMGSRQVVLTIAQPYSNHNGGMLAFGPDGLLYIGTGDGGSGGDPGNRAQSGNTLLGKMLRLDVDSLPYSSPPSNMGAQDPNLLDEIWGLGMRNPWRFSFDAGSGDLWIADVGQNVWEEIDYVADSRYNGVALDINFGWRLMEGNHCYNPSTNCNPGGNLELPIFEYGHGGNPFRCSITGGYVYRGRAMADLHGYYFYSDYCSGELLSLHDDNGQWVSIDHTPQSGNLGGVVGFGQDWNGEVYVCSGSSLRRIVPKGFRLDLGAAAAGAPVTASLTGGVPNAQIGIALSTAGLGSTVLPALGVTLGVSAPRRLVQTVADGAGAATVTRQIPASAAGTTVWLQGVQVGLASNIFVLEL